MAKQYHPPQLFSKGCLHYYSAANASKGAPILIFPDTPNMRKYHYPQRQGEFAWVLKNDKGEVIDKYSPTKPKKNKPQTPYKGSWAHTMQTA